MKEQDFQQAFLENLAPGGLLSLYELMPDVSFFMKDTDCRFVALNHLGCEFCGVQSEREAFGCTDGDFFPPDRAESYVADDRAVMNSGHPILNRIELAPEAESSPHLVVTNKIPVKDRAGRIIGVAGFSRRVENLRAAPSVIKKLAAAMELLHGEYATAIPTAELAKRVGLSVSQFERVFRKTFGVSPHQYLQRIRIDQACRLLTESEDTIAAIAQQCGYYDHAHFTKAFVSQKGLTPSSFRKTRRRDVAF